MIDVRKIKLRFTARGAKCPACGYVFTNGFSDVTNAMSGPAGYGYGSLTACTGCSVALRLYNGKLEAIPRAEELMLDADGAARLAEIRALLREYVEGRMEKPDEDDDRLGRIIGLLRSNDIPPDPRTFAALLSAAAILLKSANGGTREHWLTCCSDIFDNAPDPVDFWYTPAKA